MFQVILENRIKMVAINEELFEWNYWVPTAPVTPHDISIALKS